MKNLLKNNVFLSILFSAFIAFGILFFRCSDAYAGTETLKIYNDNDPNITYEGKIYAYNGSEDYASTYHGFYKGAIGAAAKFNFTGNKLILTGLRCNTYTSKAQITIDGINYYFCPRYGSHRYQSVLFSKTDLDEGEHTVVITNIQPSPNPVGLDFRIDSVRIDSDDILLPFEENQDSAVLKLIPENIVPSVNEDFNVDLYIDNIQGIAAEDLVINYDNTRLKFIGSESADGIMLRKCSEKNGVIKIATVSDGEENCVNSKKLLAKLKFKALGKGATIIKVTKGGVSDCKGMVRHLSSSEFGYKVLVIK